MDDRNPATSEDGRLWDYDPFTPEVPLASDPLAADIAAYLGAAHPLPLDDIPATVLGDGIT